MAKYEAELEKLGKIGHKTSLFTKKPYPTPLTVLNILTKLFHSLVKIQPSLQIVVIVRITGWCIKKPVLPLIMIDPWNGKENQKEEMR